MFVTACQQVERELRRLGLHPVLLRFLVLLRLLVVAREPPEEGLGRVGREVLDHLRRLHPLARAERGLDRLGVRARLGVVVDRHVHLLARDEVVAPGVEVEGEPGRGRRLGERAQKRLMAIRSARMAAMRDLAEQIHGLQVDSSTTVIDLMVQNDTFRGVVSGTIRGARTVRINPTGSDTYEIVLEIDRDMISYLINTARGLV